MPDSHERLYGRAVTGACGARSSRVAQEPLGDGTQREKGMLRGTARTHRTRQTTWRRPVMLVLDGHRTRCHNRVSRDLLAVAMYDDFALHRAHLDLRTHQ